MYHSKKIGVFISHIMGYYQKNVCQGIIDKALEYGYCAEIFASMDGENLGDYGLGEESILNIPNYEDMSGIIFAAETYLQPELKEKIYQTLQQNCSCPVVEIATLPQLFPAVAMENNLPVKDLTSHLIQEHGYRNICYLGCMDEAFFSDKREACYRKAMEENGLPITDTSVYTGTYTAHSAAAALSFFQSGDTRPEAVVCYNDRIALLLMAAALEAGLKLPEDLAITGCDHTEEGQYATPALTTVSFPVYELGGAAVEKLIHLLRAEQADSLTLVTSHMVCGNSCGCHSLPDSNSIFLEQKMMNRIDSLEESIFSSMKMSAAFQNITDIDEGMDLLETYVKTIDHCTEFYLCLYAGWDSLSQHILDLTDHEDTPENNPDEIALKLGLKDGKRLPECSFAKHSLLPEHIYRHSDSAYLYIPLFFQNKEFGYIALAYENNRIDYHFQLVHWFMNINQMLKRISDAKRTSVLVSHLEEIYTKDALTGLYNKHGYLLYEEQLLADAIAQSSPVTCFMFDLNRLKYINDTYGHNEGDFAIQVIGHALSSVTKEEDICARFSGDEFYLLTKGYSEEDAKELISRVYKYLHNYNKLSNKEYTISASGGFAQSTPDMALTREQIQTLFRLADEQMYTQKEIFHRQSE